MCEDDAFPQASWTRNLRQQTGQLQKDRRQWSFSNFFECVKAMSRVHVYFSLQIWFSGVFQSDVSIRNATPPCLRLSDRERPESLIERPLEAGSCWYGPKVAMAAMGMVEDLDPLGFYKILPCLPQDLTVAIDCHGWHPSFRMTWHLNKILFWNLALKELSASVLKGQKGKP